MELFYGYYVTTALDHTEADGLLYVNNYALCRGSFTPLVCF
ncbi:hypothetical protein BLGI_1746 [Brevibacillus laterosporus GI-9]|nr:hypothetical protein BLGI_1746 [Brevibacillus laterosporus GI-9]